MNKSKIWSIYGLRKKKWVLFGTIERTCSEQCVPKKKLGTVRNNLANLFGTEFFGFFGKIFIQNSEQRVRNKVRLMFGTKLGQCSEIFSFSVPNSCSAKYWRNSRPAMYLMSIFIDTYLGATW